MWDLERRTHWRVALAVEYFYHVFTQQHANNTRTRKLNALLMESSIFLYSLWCTKSLRMYHLFKREKKKKKLLINCKCKTWWRHPAAAFVLWNIPDHSASETRIRNTMSDLLFPLLWSYCKQEKYLKINKQHDFEWLKKCSKDKCQVTWSCLV